MSDNSDSKNNDSLTKSQADAMGLSGDAILDKSWQDHWQNHSDPNVQSRFQTASDVYKQSGFGEEKALEHMKGINFNREVEVVPIKSGEAFFQHQTEVGQQGNYYSSSLERSDLGIQGNSSSSQDRTAEVFITNSETTALRSTSADIESWKGTGELYYGGGEQYFTTNKEAFQTPFSPQTSEPKSEPSPRAEQFFGTNQQPTTETQTEQKTDTTYESNKE